MFTLKDDLKSIDFHDSHLTALRLEGDTLRAAFCNAVVIGRSCPELPAHIPCPLNDGEDRYAAPVLGVTFQGVTDLRILRGGCWQCLPDGGRVEIYPPRNLEPGEFPGFFRSVGAESGDLVYGLTAEGDRYTLSFWLDAGNDYYELSFTAAHTAAQWESFGGEAWYLEHYRKRRKEARV